MGVELEHQRWAVRPNQFAARIIVPDVKGTFARSIIIEPGTRALVVEDGYYVGEVPPGEYTLESFAAKLQFWRRKQTTIILTRTEHQPLSVVVEGLPTKENLTVDAKVRIVVQMADVDSFLHNLLGPRDEFTTDELLKAVAPLVRQALWTSVGQMSMDELTGPHVAQELSAGIFEAVQASLTRYGLAFIEVQAASIEHEKYQAIREKQGAVWLSNLRTGQKVTELEAFEKRAAVRQQIRQAVQLADMQKIQTKEEMRVFLEGINKDRLVRKEELEELVAAYEARKQDREGARKHMLSLLAVSRQQELDQARTAAAFAVKDATLKHEIDLARTAATKDNEAWERQIERERQAATHRYEQQMRKVEAYWQAKRASNRELREDEWEALAHEQRAQQVRGETEIATAESKGRAELVAQEYRTRADEQKLIADRRRKDWELDVADRESTQQMERLRQTMALNDLSSDKAHQRDINRLETLGKLGPEAWIATAESFNAAALADLKKHELSTSSSKLELDAERRLNEERAKMYERLNASEQDKANAIAEAFRASMASNQGTTQQVISALGLAATGHPPVAAPYVVAPQGGPPAVVVNASPAVPPPVVAQWYVAVNGQQTGPFAEPQLRQMITAGQVTHATLVWKAGLSGWSAAGQIPELFASAGPPPLS